MAKKWIAGGVLLFLVSVGIGFWFWQESIEQALPFRRIENPMALNANQEAEVPPPSAPPETLVRFKNAEGSWQVALSPEPQIGQEMFPLGLLDKQAKLPEVSVPVYQCFWKIGQKVCTSLDLNPQCSGGQAISAQPSGYVSPQIRTGFRLMVRCLTPQSERYLSLNANCENKRDRVDLIVGAIRASRL